MPGIAAVIVPLLGLIELRRFIRTLLAVSRRQQRRQVYRFEGDAPAHCFTPGGHIGGHLVDASAAGVGLVLDAPMEVGELPAVLLELEEATGEAHEVAAQVEVRSCRERTALPGRSDDRGNRPRLADAPGSGATSSAATSGCAVTGRQLRPPEGAVIVLPLGEPTPQATTVAAPEAA